MKKTPVVTKGDPIAPIDEVGVLGPRFSYSDYVGCQVAKKVVCYPTFKKLLKALDQGKITHIIIPIENTTVGGVQGINALLQRQAAVQIVGEYRLPIKHALVAGKHISDINEITTVHSHPQALNQCSTIIDRYGWDEKKSSSTSAAVFEISHLPNKAAIAPVSTAINGIHILQKDIQDLEDNLTRFVLLKKISQYEYPTDHWDRAYLFMSAVTGAHKSRTAIQDAIGMFSEYGTTIRKISYVTNGRKYTSLLEVRYAERYFSLLNALDIRKNLRIHELGQCKLRKLKPPEPPAKPKI